MRRVFSIFLILFFGLGPVTATLHADDDSGLPACCRRHGAHHCTTATRPVAMLDQSESGKPIVNAPTTCPYFPGYTVALSTTTLALAAQPISPQAILAQTHAPTDERAIARMSQVRTRAGRGPPHSSLA